MSTSPVALITGASRGIGRALALGFCQDGYQVAALARSEKDLQNLATECAETSGRLLPVVCDLANLSSIENGLKVVVQEFGQVDVLINNAGMGELGTLDVSISDFQVMLDVNLKAPFRILQEVVALMLKRKSGTIINIASRAGKIGFAGFGAYAASKFALVGLGEALYRELSPQGIRVSTLCPSWVDTQMAQEAGTPLSSQEMIQPSDLMKTVRWLMSLSPAACVSEVMIECRRDIIAT